MPKYEDARGSGRESYKEQDRILQPEYDGGFGFGFGKFSLRSWLYGALLTAAFCSLTADTIRMMTIISFDCKTPSFIASISAWYLSFSASTFTN